MGPTTPQEWTIQEVCDLVQAKFGKYPCWYQVKTALTLYAGKDVIDDLDLFDNTRGFTYCIYSHLLCHISQLGTRCWG